MPGSLTNTLYPPQVATFMPAFDYQQDAVIYFSLSPYNESTQIKRVHVTVVSQLTNENMLINTTGVFITSMEIPADQDGSGLYTVRIPYTSIKGHSDEEESKTGWQINQFYKVQLRFDAFDGEYDPSIRSLDEFFAGDCATLFISSSLPSSLFSSSASCCCCFSWNLLCLLRSYCS